MKISLILCTINRTKEIVSFLHSLEEQIYTNFEVIIVDQNENDKVKNILYSFDKLNIKYFKSKPGLSYARNIGLTHVSGKIVGFPDDDCTYPPELLKNIHTFFLESSHDIILGKTIDKKTNKIIAGKSHTFPKELSCFNFYGSSTTLFISFKQVTKDLVLFDETFGLGAKYNSGEEEDLVLRLLKDGYTGYYNPLINFVYHPPSDLNYQDFNRAKIRSIGLGALISKHIFTLCGLTYFIKYTLLQPIIKIINSCLKREKVLCKFHFYRLIGIWVGILGYTYHKINHNWFHK